VASVAAYSGYVQLSDSFAWLASPQAMTMLGVAALLEVSGYYIPAVDNLLDTITTPAALIAGTLVSAAVMTDLPPIVKWTTAIIAGGGAAGLTQGITALLRAKSTAFTAGVGNPILSTAEVSGSLIVSVLAVFVPFLALGLAVVLCWLAIRTGRKLTRRRNAAW
jgi:hypothetical protein